MGKWGQVGQRGGAQWGSAWALFGLELGSPQKPSPRRWRRNRAQGAGAARIRALTADSGDCTRVKKRGNHRLPRFTSRSCRYSSKRRRNRSSIRLVNEPPPLVRRWRVGPGADPG
jgi:hypothetical protein